MNAVIYKNYQKINFLSEHSYSCDEADEIVKSFVLSLQIPKGSFILDKNIGCDFYNELYQLSPQNFQSDLLCLLKKYASNFQLINIKSVDSLINDKNGSLIIRATLSCSQNTYIISMEVSL